MGKKDTNATDAGTTDAVEVARTDEEVISELHCLKPRKSLPAAWVKKINEDFGYGELEEMAELIWGKDGRSGALGALQKADRNNLHPESRAIFSSTNHKKVECTVKDHKHARNLNMEAVDGSFSGSVRPQDIFEVISLGEDPAIRKSREKAEAKAKRASEKAAKMAEAVEAATEMPETPEELEEAVAV